MMHCSRESWDLDAANEGSIVAMDKLRSEWPHEIDDSAKAMTTILRRMNAHRNRIPGMLRGWIPLRDAARTFTLISACLRAFNAAMDHLSTPS